MESMPNQALLIASIDLSDVTIGGRTPLDILAAVCVEAGLELQAVAPDATLASGTVVLDARYPALPLAALRALARGGAVVGPDGVVLAAVATNAGPAADALTGDHPLQHSVSADEAADVSTAWGRARAELALGRAWVRSLVESGVRVVDPDRVIVERTVQVAPGAVLWPDVVLRGSTVIAAEAQVQSGSWLVDTQVARGAIIKPHCVLEGAIVGPDAAVGPFAHLRPGAVLERAVKVGNFVEVKEAVLHQGAKASHLSYIGDADIGAGANIGAGTITCNYDGFGKHRTVIGAGAFIGSNSALVAPVTIGAGALVGAGSVIHKDVPPDAVAVERSPMRVLEGQAPVINERNRAKASRRDV